MTRSDDSGDGVGVAILSGIARLEPLGQAAFRPLELLGMSLMLVLKLFDFLVRGPFEQARFSFHSIMLARDIKDMLFDPAPRVVGISIVLGVTLALGLQALSVALLSQTGAAHLVALAAIQQIPLFVASGVLAARGALPLAVRLAEMVDRGQIDSMAIMGVDLVYLHAAPRCLAIAVASMVHAAIAMIVFGLTTVLTLAGLGVVAAGRFVPALSMLPMAEKLGLLIVQLFLASVVVVAIAVVQGLQGSGRERVDLARVSMLCIMQAGTAVLVINSAFAMTRLPDLPVLMWR